jgi:hypothetical protein
VQPQVAGHGRRLNLSASEQRPLFLQAQTQAVLGPPLLHYWSGHAGMKRQRDMFRTSWRLLFSGWSWRVRLAYGGQKTCPLCLLLGSALSHWNALPDLTQRLPLGSLFKGPAHPGRLETDSGLDISGEERPDGGTGDVEQTHVKCAIGARQQQLQQNKCLQMNKT